MPRYLRDSKGRYAGSRGGYGGTQSRAPKRAGRKSISVSRVLTPGMKRAVGRHAGKVAFGVAATALTGGAIAGNKGLKRHDDKIRTQTLLAYKNRGRGTRNIYWDVI
jgi:hypothetical protein